MKIDIQLHDQKRSMLKETETETVISVSEAYDENTEDNKAFGMVVDIDTSSEASLRHDLFYYNRQSLRDDDLDSIAIELESRKILANAKLKGPKLV